MIGVTPAKAGVQGAAVPASSPLIYHNVIHILNNV